MPAVDVRINLDELTAFIESAGHLSKLTMDEAGLAMQFAVQAVERQVVPRTPVNTGNLRQAWSTRVLPGDSMVKGEVVNPLVYAIVMEKGRKAGAKMPPKWPIVYWLRRKAGLSLEEAIDAWYPVARAIARRGIEGKRMLEKGLQAAEPEIRRTFEQAVDRALERV